jgi:Fe-S-cluster containining protein
MQPMDVDDLLGCLEILYERMDRAYQGSAARLGLTCEDCGNNCCLTRFHHHTVIEWLHLRKGLKGLSAPIRHRIQAQAQRHVGHVDEISEETGVGSMRCPLYENGRCGLYAFRPMICRLHGLPWFLTLGALTGRIHPGCRRAMGLMKLLESFEPLDRTPFYKDLAALEQEARRATGRSGKIALTVAEMILLDDGIADLNRGPQTS